MVVYLLGVLGALFLLFATIVVWAEVREWSAYWHMHRALAIRAKLEELPIFYGLMVGDGYRQLNDNCRYFSDAPLSVIVQSRGRPIGIIGFSLRPRSLHVLQLQGFRGVSPPNKDFGLQLLQCAEVIARRLDKNWVYVVPAKRQMHFDFPAGATQLGGMDVYRRRMQRRYDESSRACGYALNRSRRWWRKKVERT